MPKWTQLWLPDELAAALDRLARQEERAKAAQLRVLLREALERRGLLPSEPSSTSERTEAHR